VSVDVADIPKGTLVTDFDLDSDLGLSEVRVWGDVPIVPTVSDEGFPMDEILSSAPDIVTNLDRYMARGGNDTDLDIFEETESALGDMVRGNEVEVYVNMPDGLTPPTNSSRSLSASLSITHAEQSLTDHSSVHPMTVSSADLVWSGGNLPEVTLNVSGTDLNGPTAAERRLYPELFNSEGYLIEPEKPADMRLRPSPPPFSGVTEAIARNGQSFDSWRKFKTDLFKEDMIVFDYESTDLLDNGGKPVQLGAVKMQDGVITERFNLFMDPGIAFDEWSDFSKSNLRDELGNPITPEFMEGQLGSAEAHAQFVDFIGDASTLVGHNVKGFDLPMLQEVLDDELIDFTPDGVVDTLSLARMLMSSDKDDPNKVVDSHTLGDLTDMFGIDLGDSAHTADADSAATAELLSKMLDYANDHDLPTTALDPDRAAKRFSVENERKTVAKERFAELERVHADLLQRGYATSDPGKPPERADAQIPGAQVLDDPVRKPLSIETPDDLDPIHDVFKDNDKRLDFDLATDATPDEVIAMLEKNPDLKIDLTGEDFAVVRVRTPDGNEYEIATFRTDIGEGRRPDGGVALATIEEDVARRDLTMNALFFDLDSNEVIDYVGGIDDIENGVVRSVGDPTDRFREDKLRILRAVRFTGRTGFDLDQPTKDAILADNDLSGVSSERIREEILAGLRSAKDTKTYIQLIDELNLWPQIFQTPGSAPALNVDVGRVSSSSNPNVQLAAILGANDVNAVESTLKAMKYQNTEIADVRFLMNLSKITPTTAPGLKKEFNKRDLDKSDVLEFATAMNLPKEDMSAFVEFATAPQAVRSEDLIAAGLEGAAIGRAIAQAETELYQQTLGKRSS